MILGEFLWKTEERRSPSPRRSNSPRRRGSALARIPWIFGFQIDLNGAGVAAITCGGSLLGWISWHKDSKTSETFFTTRFQFLRVGAFENLCDTHVTEWWSVWLGQGSRQKEKLCFLVGFGHLVVLGSPELSGRFGQPSSRAVRWGHGPTSTFVGHCQRRSSLKGGTGLWRSLHGRL